MAGKSNAAFSRSDPAPICVMVQETAMIEMLYLYQLARSPLRAMARRLICRGLNRVSPGKHRCPDQ
jgi:hypothetical protein